MWFCLNSQINIRGKESFDKFPEFYTPQVLAQLNAITRKLIELPKSLLKRMSNGRTHTKNKPESERDIYQLPGFCAE